MSIELKPCPFCGGEAYLRDFGGSFHSVCCWNRACAMTCETPVRTSAEKAITDWNTRAERTCYAKPHYSTRSDTLGTVIGFDCSECACVLTQDPSGPIFWRYCPNCGAKVVE